MRVILVLALAILSTASAQADLRVQLTHKNGEVFTGIAKGGVKIEISKGGQFTKSDDAKAKGAGIRLWYWRDLDGYVFIEYPQIEKLTGLGSLSAEESASLAKAMVRVHVPTSRRKPESVTTEVRQPESKPVEPTEPAPRPEDASILKEFPIEEGWNLERFGEIQRRRIVLHLNPTKKEWDFVNRFEEFRVAFLKVEASKPPLPPVTPP